MVRKMKYRAVYDGKMMIQCITDEQFERLHWLDKRRWMFDSEQEVLKDLGGYSKPTKLINGSYIIPRTYNYGLY